MMERARELAAGTPPHRNRYVDYLRALSIAVVVLGHWLVAMFTVEQGRIIADHLLARAPWTQVLTWIFQVMPVFFMVGAYSNAASWTAARTAGQGYADWLRARSQRLLGPTVVFALAWVPLVLAGRLYVEGEVLGLGARLVAVPLWFLAVYLMVVPLAPAMLALHRRFGVFVPILLAAAAALVDVTGPAAPPKGAPLEPSWAWINFAFVWLAIHQLGYFWWNGSLERWRGTRWLLAGGGLAALIGLTFSGLYSLSLIGVPGAARGNNTPPTILLFCLALFQLGVILVSSRWANQRLARVEPWARTIVANGMIMTVYLWHLTALALLVFTGYLLGWRFLEPLTPLWWLSRLGWLALLGAVLAGFVALFGRFERPRPPTPVGGGLGSAVLTAAGALLAGAGLAGLAAQGFYKADAPLGLPLVTLALLLAGVAMVGVRPSLYRRA